MGRTGKMIEFRGRSQSLSAWSRELGIARNTLDNRLQGGMDVEEAFTFPVRADLSAAARVRNGETEIVIEFDGRRQTLREWAAEKGLHWETIRKRYRAGLPIEKVLEPVDRTRLTNDVRKESGDWGSQRASMPRIDLTTIDPAKFVLREEEPPRQPRRNFRAGYWEERLRPVLAKPGVWFRVFESDSDAENRRIAFSIQNNKWRKRQKYIEVARHEGGVWVRFNPPKGENPS